MTPNDTISISVAEMDDKKKYYDEVWLPSLSRWTTPANRCPHCSVSNWHSSPRAQRTPMLPRISCAT